MYVSERIESALRELEELYETEAVLGTLVVAGDEAEAAMIAGALRARDHSVAQVPSDLPGAAAEAGALRAFADGEARALVTTYAAWARLRREIERHAMGHSALVVGGVEAAARRYVCEWARDAHRRGLMPTAVKRGDIAYRVIAYDESDSDRDRAAGSPARADGDADGDGDGARDVWRDF